MEESKADRGSSRVPEDNGDSLGDMDSMFARMLSRADSAKTKTKGYSAGQDVREEIDAFNAGLARYNSTMLEKRGGWGLGQYPEAVDGNRTDGGEGREAGRLACKNVKATANRGTCFVVENALSSNECKELIGAATDIGLRPVISMLPASFRNNTRMVIEDEGLASWLWALVKELVPASIRTPKFSAGTEGKWDAYGIDPQKLRFGRYCSGEHFGPHTDEIFANRLGTLESKLSLLVYLNGDYEGGALRMLKSGANAGAGGKGKVQKSLVLATIQPTEGMVVVFDQRLTHEAEGIQDGAKYILHVDVVYVKQGTDRNEVVRYNKQQKELSVKKERYAKVAADNRFYYRPT